VHFPFCQHRCHYCDFSVKRARTAPVGEWIDSLDRELADWFGQTGWTAPLALQTLFVGGGTPSLLAADGMRALADLLLRYFRWDAGEVEWTVEANPASFSRDIAREWRAIGVTRVSLGVQSLVDGALRWLGRLHDRRGALDALHTAVGEFDSVSADLIFGLPDEVARDWLREVEEMVATGVRHVSVYGLTVEPRTPLARWIELGRFDAPDQDRYAVEYAEMSAHLTDCGFDHYEISNFARPGYECLHNWQYWNGAAYLGIGPSAHSFLPPYRMWNVFRWDAYRGATHDHAPTLSDWESVAGRKGHLERLWLSMRTRCGLSTEDPIWSNPAIAERRDRWARAGWLDRREGRVVATTEGWLRLDALVADMASGEGERS
jgi:oxygen-independent coproporphyrinogen-3 oxidase